MAEWEVPLAGVVGDLPEQRVQGRQRLANRALLRSLEAVRAGQEEAVLKGAPLLQGREGVAVAVMTVSPP
jgi:hypothetical protein